MNDVSNRRPPRSRRPVPGLVALTTILLVAVASAVLSFGGTAEASNARLALTVPANPTVGPLFTNGIGSGHSCTASVLSAGRGLILTAAHCVSGTAQGVQFVPGYDGTKADPTPYGIWTVDRAWVPAGWTASQNPQDDFAILQVSDSVVNGQSTSLNQLVGGNAVGLAVGSSGAVTVPAYLAGADDAPISCTAALEVDQGFPTFGCSGYTGGTSGAPWLEASEASPTAAVVGVIGGLHQGGCTDSTSYSSDFDSDVYLLIIRAVVGLPSDTVPAAGADGC